MAEIFIGGSGGNPPSMGSGDNPPLNAVVQPHTGTPPLPGRDPAGPNYPDKYYTWIGPDPIPGLVTRQRDDVIS